MIDIQTMITLNKRGSVLNADDMTSLVEQYIKIRKGKKVKIDIRHNAMMIDFNRGFYNEDVDKLTSAFCHACSWLDDHKIVWE